MIIDPRGYVIINSHVIPDYKLSVEFITAAGKRYIASVVSRDKVNDLVLLKVDQWDKKADFPHVEFGDITKLKSGDPVFALGYPGGKSICVCNTGKGILEASLIKHDAELGPKMNGGPLVDLEGNLIGIHKNKTGFWRFGKYPIAISAEVVKQFF